MELRVYNKIYLLTTELMLGIELRSVAHTHSITYKPCNGPLTPVCICVEVVEMINSCCRRNLRRRKIPRKMSSKPTCRTLYSCSLLLSICLIGLLINLSFSLYSYSVHVSAFLYTVFTSISSYFIGFFFVYNTVWNMTILITLHI